MIQAELSIPHRQIDLVTSKHREQLVSIMRYARFLSGETPVEWQALLGPDVIGLTHPEVVADIAQRFVSFNQQHGIILSAEEQTLLLTTPWMHGWGEMVIEGVGIGDITFEHKTSDHEAMELQVFLTVLNDIPENEVREVMRNVYAEIAKNCVSKLGRMFNAVERIGYLETAIRAFIGVDGRHIANWRGFVGNVLSNQIEKLLEYRREYPYVDEVLIQTDDTIDRMFTAVLADGVPLDNAGEVSYDLTKLQKAKKAWSKRGKKRGQVRV